ncbi:MAG TPA: hypothetical protein VMC09_01450, partial [Anaerolineales bacterium]|nr:hypothetical protein [Anaerolineales bacterium]
MKKFKLSWGWFGIGLIVLSLLLHLYIALSPANSVMHWYTSDDAFFYFKVAANITSGHGATFDGINHTNGFHPLWMLICIPVFILARFNLILPLRILVLISALLNAGTGYLLFSLLRKFISNITAAAVAVIWVFLPTIQGGVTWGGMETAVNAFCLMLLLTLAVRWRGESIGIWKMLALGCAAGLAVLARLDNVFVVLLLGVWFVFGSASGYLRTIVVGDLALVFLSGMLSYFIRLRTGPFYQRFSVSLPALIGLGFVIKPLMLFLFKLYPPLRERLSMKMIARTLLAISLSALIIGGSLLLLKGVGIFKDLPRSVIIIDWVGTLLGVLGLRFFAWLISS